MLEQVATLQRNIAATLRGLSRLTARFAYCARARNRLHAGAEQTNRTAASACAWSLRESDGRVRRVRDRGMHRGEGLPAAAWRHSWPQPPVVNDGTRRADDVCVAVCIRTRLEYSHSRRFTTWAFWVVSCGNFCFSQQITTYRTLSSYQLNFFRTKLSSNGVLIYRK